MAQAAPAHLKGLTGLWGRDPGAPAAEDQIWDGGIPLACEGGRLPRGGDMYDVKKEKWGEETEAALDKLEEVKIGPSGQVPATSHR